MLEGREIALERIGIDEEVRRLDEEQLRVVGEVADRLAQEVARRRVVGVEHGDEFAGRVREAVVEVAGLGVLVARARQVAARRDRAQSACSSRAPLAAAAMASSTLSNCAFLVGAAVVEQPDRQLVGADSPSPLAAARVVGEKVGILVVGRDEDVDGRQRSSGIVGGDAAAGSGVATTNRLSASITTLYISAR